MQTTLFGRAPAPSFDPSFRTAKRIELDPRGGWIDRVQGWIEGHEALFAELRTRLEWRAQRRVMYEHVVDVPRLFANPDEHGGVPILQAMAATLSRRYGYEFRSISLALYRDGRDSVAWHRDKKICNWPHACVAVASLGGSRRFCVRPLGGGPTRTLTTGWGDLVVMGGTCQRHWEHAVPKQKHAEPRMAVMFRHGAPRESLGTSGSQSPRG